MSAFEKEFTQLQEHCRKSGAMDYHLHLLDSPLLSNDEKLKLAAIWGAYSGNSASATEALIAEWNRQTAKTLGIGGAA